MQCARTLIHTCLLVPGENRAAGRQVRRLFTVYPIQKTRQALTEERFAKKTALFVNELHSGLKTKELCPLNAARGPGWILGLGTGRHRAAGRRPPKGGAGKYLGVGNTATHFLLVPPQKPKWGKWVRYSLCALFTLLFLQLSWKFENFQNR